MNQINSLHTKAMNLVELALLERLQGNTKRELELNRQALKYELAAIQSLEEPIEPTFSVLHRSAGTLALRCQNYRLAEQIAAKALAAEPPFEIAEELRDLLEQVHFQRHLELRGVELGHDEVQMSLSGSEVGFGMVSISELVDRIRNASKLIGRIVDWKNNAPFSERGPKASTLESFPVLVSAPRAASFAVTLKVGRPSGQLNLPIVVQQVVDQFMDLMESIERSNVDELRYKIPEPEYLRNFIGLAKKIAPDGRRVRQVGFTVEGHGRKPRFVSIKKTAAEIPPPTVINLPSQEDIPGKPVEVRGILRFADARSEKGNVIKIVGETGRGRSVRVPVGMMNDIVRPLWDSKVIVKGLRKKRTIFLQDIELDKSGEDVEQEM